MNVVLELWLHKMSYALGWTLLNSLWQAALVWAVFHLLIRIPQKNNPVTQYWLALCGFVAVVSLSVATFVQYYKAYSEMAFWLDINLASYLVIQGSHGFFAIFNYVIDEVVVIWVLGFLFAVTRYIGAIVYCEKLKKISESPSLEVEDKIFKPLVATLSITKQVSLKISSRVGGPCIIGHFKPVLLMPAALVDTLTKNQLVAVFLHELAHVKRNDYLVGVIQGFIKTLYFFNPFMLYLSRNIDIEREHICDDMAVAICGDALLYSKTLEQLAHLPEQRGLAMAMTGQKNQLLYRVKRQFQQGSVQKRPLLGVAAVLVFVMGLMVITTHAIGDAIPEREYSGIQTLTNEQVASLIVIARNAVLAKNNKGEHLRENVLDSNKAFLKMNNEERALFLGYLSEDLWDIVAAEQWEFDYPNAPDSVIESFRHALFEKSYSAKFQHLYYDVPQVLIGGDGFSVKAVPDQNVYELRFSKSYLIDVVSTPNLVFQEHDWLAMYDETMGLTLSFSKEGDAINAMQALGADVSWAEYSMRELMNSGVGDDGAAVDSVYAHVDAGKSLTRIRLSSMLVQHLMTEESVVVGNSYVGLESNKKDVRIYLDVVNASKNRKAIERVALGFEPQPIVELDKWALLQKRIDALPLSGKRLLPTDDDMEAMRIGLSLSKGFEITPQNFESVRYSLTVTAVEKIESGSEEALRMLSHRPWYSKGDNDIYVALRNFKPLAKNTVSFDLELKDVLMKEVYAVVAKSCPARKPVSVIENYDQPVTVNFKHLNCERVNTVMEFVEKGVQAKIDRVHNR